MGFCMSDPKMCWKSIRKVAKSSRREVSGSEELGEKVLMISTGQMRQAFLAQKCKSVFLCFADFSICKTSLFGLMYLSSYFLPDAS